ncbi:transglutaminase-like domain-containing protein [Haliangium ochraceum]|uniref:Transglutaminase domain protein n=1 Tax=Haliangium ochraceum (strain DSM 14365 / JCM 11303 / SMP-2) TaxID=502025 RepID=D0LHC0_HALO1|nr:transglutaminase-like domain-containing protein [Haliangium ochraceum]ACY18265.1 transglutaminase domain protein [Haliangium ochraceum DSM 14365]
MSASLSALSTLPFAAQLQLIERALATGEREEIAALVRALAALRDHEPLAYAVVRGAQGDRLDALAEVITEVFREVPDTGVQRVLRALDRNPVPGEQQDIIVTAVRRALESLPLARVAALCLMDRWLKNASPAQREAVADRALTHLRAALQRAPSSDSVNGVNGGGDGESDPLDKIPDELLMRVPGARLYALADELPAPRRAALAARLGAFATRVLDILEAAPKSLSQANAEELLSRRVYTDPGHFLVELLQNAEDAGARCWRADIDAREVSVWHDGVPFDAKDVVGVLSIGQTTKHKEQIGFFGVGFKSVYEICERPQVYSGPFRFEIADVSLPRRLAARPEGYPEHGTLLVLPLREPEDPARTPERLYQRAREVPPETLLTLRNIREMRIAQPAQSRTIRAEAGTAPGDASSDGAEPNSAQRIDLVHLERDTRTRYIIARERATWEGQAREGSRSSSTEVLVALRIAPDGVPVPLSEGEATVYSYLPTRERSRLRFLVHAHFDLPVDRERLDLDSPYNRWLLVNAGTLLAGAGCRAIAGDPARARAMLAIWPRADNLPHPAYAALADAARAELRERACLPGADGGLVAPALAALADAALADDPAVIAALARVAEDGLDGAGQRLLQPLLGDQRRTAAYLGAREFGVAELIALLARRPASVATDEFALLGALARHADHADVVHLSDVAFARDSDGRRAAPARLARADAALRAIYGRADTAPRSRRLLAAELDAHAGAHGPDPRTSAAGADALTPLWNRLRVPVLGAGELVADLAEPRTAAALLDEAGATLVVAYLAARPTQLIAFLDALSEARIAVDEARARALLGAFAAVVDELSPRVAARLGRTPLFPDRAGRLRPLLGADAALVPGDDDIAALVPELPWLAADLAATTLLGRLLVQLERRAVGAAEVARALSRTQAGNAADESPAVALIAAALSAAPDHEHARLRRVYAYLSSHADALPGGLRRGLAEAAVWLSRRGERLPLAALRQAPHDPVLIDLYRAWDAVPLIDEGTRHAAEQNAATPDSALALARALALDGQVRASDHDALIDDLLRGFDVAPVRDAVRAAVCDAARILPRTRLLDAARAHMFRAESAGTDDDSGELLPLRAWSPPPPLGSTEAPACHRAHGPLRAALRYGTRPLLDPADEEAWAPFLAVVDIAPAALGDLVAALERDPAMFAAAARDAARRALAALPAATLDSAGEALRTRLRALPLWPSTAGARRPAADVVRLGDIAALLASTGSPAGAAAQLDDDWRRAFAADSSADGEAQSDSDGDTDGGALALLDEATAGAEADALAALMGFADPQSALRAAIHALARPGQALSAQPPLLATAARVAKLASTVHTHAGAEAVLALPLAVDARGRLVPGPLYRASANEHALLGGLPLGEQLAAPDWAAAAPADLVPSVSVRQILAALAEDSRDAVPASEHPRLSAPERRATLYRWLLTRAGDILDDAQARGLLARAAVIATPGGYLRPVRELLLDPELPELGIDWNAADEVPSELIAWLRRHFAPDERQLGRLLGHLLDAHDDAAAAADGARSAELLGHLARSLRIGEVAPEQVAAAVKRFKLRKRLRVETDTGSFARPRTLLAPPAADLDLLTGFAQDPPARVAARYADERVRQLIAHAGASEQLERDPLSALLAGDGRAPDPEAALALSRYIARCAERTPALRDELRLASAAWIADGTATLRQARALYWLESDAPQVVGRDPRLYPHPTLVHTMAPRLADWLPFRRLDEAALADVCAHIKDVLADGQAPGIEILSWLERGLERGGRAGLRPAEVRDALGEYRFLRDDDGHMRTPAQVLREDPGQLFGRRRGTWSTGDEVPRLASALKIAKWPGKREVLAYFDELVEDIDHRTATHPEIGHAAVDAACAALLAEEPGLSTTLPRCLSVLAEAGGALPERLPLACESAALGPCLSVAPDARLLVPEPLGGDAEAARRAPADARFPVLPAGDAETVVALLLDFGIPPLLPRAEPAPVRSDERPAQRRAKAPQRRSRARDSEPASDAARDSEPDARAASADAASADGENNGRGLLSRLRNWLAPRDDDEQERDRPQQRASGDASARPEDRPPPPPVRSSENAIPPLPSGSSARSRPDASASAGARSGDSDPDGASPDPDSPPSAPDQRHWFRPRQRIGAQMHDHSAWAHDRQRASSYGLAYQPRALPAPFLYGPQTVAGRFQPAGQRWLEIAMPPSWRRSPRPAQHTLRLRGRLPLGETLLPVPLFGQVTDVRTTPEARLVETRNGAPLIVAAADTEVAYTVELPPAPRYEGARIPDSAPAALLAPTAPDAELPDEALRFAEALAADDDTPLARALAVRDFVRSRYYYDPAYLETPEVARWLARVTRGRVNAHLAALHAGRDARYLGRGVCYELNAMACELLRRAGIPAAVSSGWTFDRGHLDEPDHMWAMALLEVDTGPCWLPIDASTTRDGQPLHVGRRPAGPWQAPAGSAPPPPPPRWAGDTQVRRYEPDPAPLGDLVRVVRFLAEQTGEELGEAQAVRALCGELLRDPRAARRLLAALRSASDGGEPTE